MKEFIQKILRGLGYQFTKYPLLDIRRRIKIVKHYDIDLILDVGANTGQYAMDMRNNGYNNRIISFEPLTSAYLQLLNITKNDPLWSVRNIALGDTNEKSTINVSGHSLSSSILDMMPKHLEFSRNSEYIGKEDIEIKTLDSIFNELYEKRKNVMLKIDTQGYEKNVLDGASDSLKNILLLQLEMSIFRMYKGEMLFSEMMDFLTDKNYRLISLENGIHDENTGELLQADGIFVNTDLLQKVL